MIDAVAYMRTSSAAGVGDGKDSEPRQRAAITEFAALAGYTIDDADWYYDPKVKGKDSINNRPGFAAMLERIASNGVRVIIVETANRFARDLIVQETGWRYLKDRGITLIAADSPDAFVDDTPTATMIRQILGAVAEFEKASLVAKLQGARLRKRLATGKKVGGRKSYAETNPQLVMRANALKIGRSLREIATELAAEGFYTPTGKVYAPMAVRSMINAAA
jgi:DNA invertase Pin-like site-specific DNA recombinase